MKLLIEENKYKYIIYVDMVKFSELIGYQALTEDEIPDTHRFIKGFKYNDEFDTRQYILANYIVPFAKNLLNNYNFVVDYDAHSSKDGNSGLSNYITIIFEHPDSITDDELEDNYMYTIRFSDHENKHPELGDVEEVDMTDMKASNLMKAGMRVFKRKLSDVQRNIAKFEIEKFGEQQTFFDM